MGSPNKEEEKIVMDLLRLVPKENQAIISEGEILRGAQNLSHRTGIKFAAACAGFLLALPCNMDFDLSIENVAEAIGSPPRKIRLAVHYARKYYQSG